MVFNPFFSSKKLCSKYFHMDFIAQMSCILRVNVHCEGCKRKIMEVLQNLKGVYSVVLDAKQGTVKVNGKVDPTIILNVFDKYGKHGEVSSVRFDGEVMEQIPCSFYGENPYIPYEMPYPPIPYPFLGGAEQQWCGRNQYLMPLLPPLRGPMPQPSRPPPPQQQPPPPPPPVSKAPSAPPAPPPPHPKCCTIM